MNTTISIKAVQTTQSTIQMQEAIHEALGEFQKVVDKFTRFNDNSELSNLNRNSGKWTKVSKELFKLIEFMLDMAKKTDGAFDPTVIDYLEEYGYDKDYNFSKLDNPKLQEKLNNLNKNRKSWAEIKLDDKRTKILLVNGQRLDLGGIGKGYAMDLARIKLTSRKIYDFFILGGGDLIANGLNLEGKEWTAVLKSDKSDIGIIHLKNEALAASGSWARKVRQFHHLIDTKSGKPAERDYKTVFVKAKTAMIADAWATALFINADLDYKKYNLKAYFK